MMEDPFSDCDVEEERSPSAGGRAPARFSSSFGPARFFPGVPRRAVRQVEQCLLPPASANDGCRDTAVLPPAGSAGQHLQEGHLEMLSQQRGVEQGGEIGGVQGAAGPRPASSQQEDGDSLSEGRAPSEPTSGVWVIDGEVVRFAQDERKEEKEEENEEKKEEKEESIEEMKERMNELKEKIARAIREKERQRKPCPRVIPVDPEVVEKMLGHVNPRKGHIDATPEEVLAGSHEGGKKEEFGRFLECDVFKYNVKVPKGRKKMKCRWVLTWKMKEGKRVAKARLVVKGFQDDRKELKTFSGTAEWWTVLLVLSFAATKGWSCAKSDVRTAFLTAPISDEVYVELPTDLPSGLPEFVKPGMAVRLNRAMYGLADAPRLFSDSFRKIVSELGWKEETESIFLLHDSQTKEVKAVMVRHVDDILIFAADPLSHFSPIQSRLKMDEPEELQKDEVMTYIGMQLRKTEKGFEISQEDYLKSVQIDETKLKGGKLDQRVTERPEEEEIDEKYVPLMQKIMGVAGWVARTSPSIAFLFGELSRWSQKPSAEKVEAALRLLCYAQSIERPLCFTGVSDPKIVVYHDGSYSLQRCEGRSGYEVYLVDKKVQVGQHDETNLFAWRSARVKRKLNSSTSSELVAGNEAVKKAFAWKRMAEALWQRKIEIEFVTDSGPLMEQLESGQTKSEPALEGLLKYVRQELRALRARVFWCQTDKMKADRQTKLKLERVKGDAPVSPETKKESKKEGARRQKIDFSKRAVMRGC
uniref:Reverse transcriptase Ty1/copia-type domain-containing protein n=1 Tax=Chromera velia CCMP2878 TaxID=1169474 RepID=A0A0G4IE68_9ALVE|eukprot:Cvel_13644.t1-p1 / transcript=Cvel_13644.t1 / gene=Cvel_13644 / organism=Chromera_velia_CCMP2878 / gene_product=Retrovirus-related Pol polyprotein from transposon, putative / transcript_product=Retrovirus-related Pol polyprotein from transposon, putative / location=Cvel_scaffold940:58127-60391(+) / protein_length=755 / sequence_SO=supercontig / SO=protein_coding / is_pseudo=false